MPPLPLSYAACGGAALPVSRSHWAAQSATGSPEAAGMTLETPSISHRMLTVSRAVDAATAQAIAAPLKTMRTAAARGDQRRGRWRVDLRRGGPGATWG